MVKLVKNIWIITFILLISLFAVSDMYLNEVFHNKKTLITNNANYYSEKQKELKLESESLIDIQKELLLKLDEQEKLIAEQEIQAQRAIQAKQLEQKRIQAEQDRLLAEQKLAQEQAAAKVVTRKTVRRTRAS